MSEQFGIGKDIDKELNLKAWAPKEDDASEKPQPQGNPEDKSKSSNEETVQYEASSDGEGVCDVMRRAAVDAAKFNDYISYATILDELIADPLKFDENERIRILETLRDILAENDQLTYDMGWDIPILALKYLVTSYDFEAAGIPGSATARILMSIFSILCNKGNPKELFLKVCEVFSTWDVTEPDALMEKHGHSESVNSQYQLLKFYLCFELMFYSLRRISSDYPSRFLATAITVLLSFVASNGEHLTVLAIGVIARRLYVFCRDYCTPGEESTDKEKQVEVSELEWAKQVKLIQTCLTWSANLSLQYHSVKWSERLYQELKAGVATNTNVSQRETVYDLTIYLSRLADCIERMSQLAMSLDMDPLDELRHLLDASSPGESDDDDDEPDSSFSTLSKYSQEGILILATQNAFDDRTTEPLSIEQLYNLVQRFLIGDGESAVSTGVQDAVIFWLLWSTRNVTEEQIQNALDKDRFSTMLQQLMLICAHTSDKTTRFIIYSMCAKFLRLQKPEISFEVLLDTLEFCPYANLQEAAVRMLKCLGSQPPKQVSNVDQLEDKLKSLSVASQGPCTLNEPHRSGPRIHLDSEKLTKLQPLISRCVSEVGDKLQCEEFTLLLSWLNFMTIIKMDEAFGKSIIEKCRAMVPKEQLPDKKNEDPRVGILALTTESAAKVYLL